MSEMSEGASEEANGGDMFSDTVITLMDTRGHHAPVTKPTKDKFPKRGPKKKRINKGISRKLKYLTSPTASRLRSPATKRISIALDQNWDDKTSMCIRQERTEIANFWFKYQHPKYELLSVRLNPFTTFVSLFVIVAFICWCITDPEHAQNMLFDIKKSITQLFTWLYIGTQDLRTVFILWLYFSKWGNVKLGKDNDQPEFSDAEWFSMLFACGVGIGLFFFGISEPLRHYSPSDEYPINRFIMDGYLPDNTLAQTAMNITYYHWGLHAWVVYCIVGIILAFTSYRWDLPLTMKSCFYPLIGEKIFGWLGDSVDTLSIITTIFGVCTSLGLGAMQVSAGLHNLNSNIPMSTNVQIGIIWVITFCATISVVSGLRRGVRRVSQVCFFIGMFLMLVVFFLESPQFLLNLFIQSLGFYVQNIIQLSFHCDAFEQLNPSSGGEDRKRRYDEPSDGHQDWMNDWTIFYWSWWITWSPFVGAFIAKISRGRTIKEFIHGSITAPVMYSFLWLTIFGGSGIKMEREAAAMGLCCPNWNNTHAELTQNGSLPVCKGLMEMNGDNFTRY